MVNRLNYCQVGNPGYSVASKQVRFNLNGAEWGLSWCEEWVSDFFLWSSNGYDNYRDGGIRPVVTLKSNVKLSGNSADGWTIQ